MMRRRRVFTASILAVSVFLMSLVFSGAIFAQSVYEVKGKVKGVSNKAKTISVSVKDKGAMIFRFNDDTQYIHADSAKAFKKGEGAVVKYKTVGPDMVAVEIKKAIAAIPEGGRGAGCAYSRGFDQGRS